MGSSFELLEVDDLRPIFIKCAAAFAATALPLLLLTSATAVGATMLQTKGYISGEAVKFKLDKLNPLNGLKRMFSLRSAVEIIKSLLKIIVLGFIIYGKLSDEMGFMPRLMDMSAGEAVYRTSSIIFEIAKSAAVIMAFLAAADYLYQWWDYEKKLMMSKQEIKEEYKQTEGDPQVKGKLRERRQQQARRRMMQNVPQADVIIRNPTHFAVALRYKPEEDNAPVIIAKGMDNIALRIVKIAEENGIPAIENRPLARGLYESVEIGQTIPDKFYGPVAEVLAFVYKLKKEFAK